MEEKKQPDERIRGEIDFDSLPEGDGVLVLSPQGQIMSANLQSERILGMKLIRGQRLDIRQVVAEEHRPRTELAWREVLSGTDSQPNLVARISPESGMPVSLIFSMSPLRDLENRVMGVILTFRDTATGSTDTDKEARLTEYDSLFEQLAEGVFTINNRWRITSFNLRAQDITGFSREEVLGRHCWDIFKSDLCRTDCPLKITMETGIVSMDQDVRIVVKGGQPRSILVNASAIKNEKGLVVGAVETFRPISMIDQSEADRILAEEEEIVGQSAELVRLLRLLPDVAASETTVLIEGESGTGKELIAKAIHRMSPRSRGPFVPVNCSALAETLLESEIFGHVKGAFTGAINSKVGRFELAKGGTLFLDEIGEIKPDIQVKLLRVIEEGVFERVGGNRPIRMDARIIAATNKTLLQEVQERRFRQDLFYRLRTVPLYLPPLRDRKSDIPLLVMRFLAKFNQKYKKDIRGVDPKVLRLFHRYNWPGNIRELERAVEYSFVFVKGPIITPSHLPELKEAVPFSGSGEVKSSPDQDLLEDQKAAIENVLRKTQGRRDEAARFLGISRTSLWRKMKTHGLV